MTCLTTHFCRSSRCCHNHDASSSLIWALNVNLINCAPLDFQGNRGGRGGQGPMGFNGPQVGCTCLYVYSYSIYIIKLNLISSNEWFRSDVVFVFYVFVNACFLYLGPSGWTRSPRTNGKSWSTGECFCLTLQSSLQYFMLHHQPCHKCLISYQPFCRSASPAFSFVYR